METRAKKKQFATENWIVLRGDDRAGKKLFRGDKVCGKEGDDRSNRCFAEADTGSLFNRADESLAMTFVRR